METTSKPVRNKGDRLLWAKITGWPASSVTEPPYEHTATIYYQRYDADDAEVAEAIYTGAKIVHSVRILGWVPVVRRVDKWYVVADSHAVLEIGEPFQVPAVGTTRVTDRSATSAGTSALPTQAWVELGQALRVIDINPLATGLRIYRLALNLETLYIADYRTDPPIYAPLTDFFVRINTGTSESPVYKIALQLGNVTDATEETIANVAQMPVTYDSGTDRIYADEAPA